MLTQTLAAIFTRDLNKLKVEITAYTSDANLWLVDKNIANSGGNLCLHLIGNLNGFIGAEIGKSGYIRIRDLEFSQKGLTRAELLLKIEATITVVNHALTQLPEADLSKEYPILVFAEPMTYEFFLLHLATHLSFHLGQINYHRRLLDI